MLDVYTPSIGLSFGIISFSSTITQQIIVPELLLIDSPQETTSSPSKNYFKLPLFLATFLAFLLKCAFAIVGAMMLTDQSNIFDDMIFSR